MISNNVDLTNCDKEPIHIPARIQPHGFLIALNTQSLLITYASDNSINFISAKTKSLLNLSLPEFETAAGFTAQQISLLQLLKSGELQRNSDFLNPYLVDLKGLPYYLIISVSGSEYLLEFEPVAINCDIQSQIGKSVSAILSGKDLESLLYNTAKEVKEIIGYDRIMIYKFLDDGHGEVIEEIRNDNLEPFYGLHYPASDIPKQARELYKLNYIRIIADVDKIDAKISTLKDNAALDLTYSVLRAVSPMHIQYLKNMGVASSFSISLIVKGELWGLIACHNYSPKFIDYKLREAGKLIGEIVSSALEYKTEAVQAEQSYFYQEAISLLNVHLSKDDNIISALTEQKYTLKDINSANGVAIIFDGEISTVGETPATDNLEELANWLLDTMDDNIYYTDSLSADFPPAITYKETGSGIIACILSREMKEIIIWFKPEQITDIKWAGNPDKPALPAASGEMSLSPRNSFDVFTQLVKYTAVKWTKLEISNVLKIRDGILDTINKRAGQIRVSNERLKRAYDELDTFSYTLSHDLRTPLTSIKSYTQLVIAANKSLNEQGKSMLDRVVAGANKMEFLINEVLNLAKVGRLVLEVNEQDMNELVREVATEVTSSLNVPFSRVTIDQLPPVSGDHTLMMQLFTNLISNAVKYSAGAAHPKVSVRAEVTNEEIIYQIRDNGIGIPAEQQNEVFELFRRMENARQIEGTGVGLAIVKRIVERHNARIWFESELNAGTVFYLAFKK